MTSKRLKLAINNNTISIIDEHYIERRKRQRDPASLSIEAVVRFRTTSNRELVDFIFNRGGLFTDPDAIGVARYRGLIGASLSKTEAFALLERREQAKRKQHKHLTFDDRS